MNVRPAVAARRDLKDRLDHPRRAAGVLEEQAGGVDQPRQGRVGLMAAARRYALPLVALVLLIVPGAVVVERALYGAPQYESSALVVANTLEIRPEELPRFAVSVFEGGSVARSVAAADRSGADFRKLVPDVISVEPVQQSIAFRVIGRAEDRVEAAELANLASRAFVLQLNKVGEGVGLFSQQDVAYPALAPAAKGLGPVGAALVGLVAAALAGLALLWLLMTVRRPVMTGAEAAAAAGVPLLAEVSLPTRRQRRRGRSPVGVRAMARALIALKADDVVLAGDAHTYQFRKDLVDEVEVLRANASVVDGRRPDLRILLPEDVGLSLTPMPVVVAVAAGTPAGHVGEGLHDYAPGEMIGTVLLRRGVRRSRKLRRSTEGEVAVRPKTPRTPAPAAAAQPRAARR